MGVDLGCGMLACKTMLRADDLPDTLGPLGSAIELWDRRNIVVSALAARRQPLADRATPTDPK